MKISCYSANCSKAPKKCINCLFFHDNISLSIMIFFSLKISFYYNWMFSWTFDHCQILRNCIENFDFDLMRNLCRHKPGNMIGFFNRYPKMAMKCFNGADTDYFSLTSSIGHVGYCHHIVCEHANFFYIFYSETTGSNRYKLYLNVPLEDLIQSLVPIQFMKWLPRNHSMIWLAELQSSLVLKLPWYAF